MLIESEARFHQVAENLTTALYLTDSTDGEILYANKAWRDIWGVRDLEEQLELVHPDDRRRVARVRRQQEVGLQKSVALEYRIVHEGGNVRWIEAHRFPILNGHGEIYRWAGMSTDITDRKRTEAEMRASEARFAEILAIAHDAVISVNEDHRITLFNQGAERIFGYRASEVIGEPLEVLLPSRLVALHREHIQGFATSTVAVQPMNERGPISGVRKDGTDFPAEASISKIVHAGETIFTVMLRDITERLKAETLLRDSNLRLEDTISELKEAQTQIVQQERLRALGEMAAGIAHDFNNQLTGVLGFTELLLNRPGNLDDKENVTRALQSINTAAKDAAEVVRRLREFYRPLEDADSFALIDLRRLVEQVVSFTQPKWHQQAQSKGVDVKLETDLSEVRLISGNEAALREVLTNLVFNAVDAMQTSGRITVRAFPEGEDAVLSVQDTGTGMTEEVRQRCMEPFFSTKGEGGSGLGLSLAYGVIQRHKGTIEIKSQIGSGTTVLIRLPVEVGRRRRTIGKEAVAKPGALHILAVDDEPLSRQVVAGYLTADGHTVETATNGQEALAKFVAGEFDLVITDQAMPVMNGDQLAAMIKEKTPDTPVILLAGFGDIILAEDERVENVAIIVSKPITLSGLREALAKVIDNGGAPV